eukprot:1156048-Pelagomonas_calceolata.AAC.15
MRATKSQLLLGGGTKRWGASHDVLRSAQAPAIAFPDAGTEVWASTLFGDPGLGGTESAAAAAADKLLQACV